MKIVRKLTAAAMIAALALPGLSATAASAATQTACKAATGNASLHKLAAGHNDSASKVLRETAEHSPSGKFTRPTSQWLNAVFSPANTTTATDKVPSGVLLCYAGKAQAGARVRSAGGLFMDGSWSLHDAAVANEVTSALILRESASLESGHVYARATARWLNRIFAGKLSAKRHASRGVRLAFRSGVQ